MPLSYLAALDCLHLTAQRLAKTFAQDEEQVPLIASVGRVATRALKSPVSLPSFDTSAMDGYALRSELTLSASPTNPVRFEVKGTIAAGDQPICIATIGSGDIPACVEIMTGAQFPVSADGQLIDACIPIEQIERVEVHAQDRRFIQITRPVGTNQHRRPAGSDIEEGEELISPWTVLRNQHIMALASVGVREVTVSRRARVSICATGSELVRHASSSWPMNRIRDSNGPYLTKALEDHGAEVILKDPVVDDLDSIRNMLSDFEMGCQDILITTGGVSAGRCDLIRQSLERQGAKIHFHKVAVRPGHPILFATTSRRKDTMEAHQGIPGGAFYKGLPESPGEKAIFGLPGNPMAAAACLQFFVIPFLKRFTYQRPLTPIHACLQKDERNGCSSLHRIPQSQNDGVDQFRHGVINMENHRLRVTLAEDQASYKVRPIMRSNCWVWIPPLHNDAVSHEMLACYPFSREACAFAHQETEDHHKKLHMDAQLGSNRAEIWPMPAKLLLLAGGLSTRMGSAKHLLPVRSGLALYEHLLQQAQQALGSFCDQDIYISLRSDAQIQELKQIHYLHNRRHLPYNILTDLSWGATGDKKEIGPAAGLLTAFASIQATDWLVLACDYPLFSREALDQLLSEHCRVEDRDFRSSVTCFVNSKGFYEPLLGVWSPQALQKLQENVQRGRYGPSQTVLDLVQERKARLVKPLDQRWILGANTPGEWEQCMALDIETEKFQEQI